MSKEINPLEAMLSQYENNNKPKYEKSTTAKVYDLKNYFNTYIEDQQQMVHHHSLKCMVIKLK